MKIIEIKFVEDCLDGSFIRDVVLNEIITEEFISFLRAVGELKYYKDFPRPFFQVKNKNFLIKGILGNNYLQVIFYTKEKKIEDILINDLKLFKGG